MQDTERQKFEDNWKSAFDGAEMAPPDRVWNSIELAQEGAAMKKKVVFYQRLAAATVLFALLTGVYAFYPKREASQLVIKDTEQKNVEQGISKEQQNTEGIKNQESQIINTEGIKNQESKIKNTEGTSKSKFETQNSKLRTPHSAQSIDQIAMIDNNEGQSGNKQLVENSELRTQNSELSNNTQHQTSNTEHQSVDKQVADNTKTTQTNLEPSTQNPTLISPLLSDEDDTVVEPKQTRKKRESLWLALGAAAGNYTPNTPSASALSAQTSFLAGPTTISNNKAAQAQQTHEPKIGTSYSFGMSVGKRFGRVVIQTGVSLGKQQCEYISNYTTTTSGNTNTSKAAVSDYLLTADNGPLNFTNDYTVNSTMEIVSIPVQAGYIIIDRKIGLQLNAGVAPDFFIKNTLVDKSGQRESFTQSAGSDSPYRSVNWSGLANTELSYRLGSNYRLSLVPGVRYSFNSILKEPTGSGRPFILDVGFRFKYIFD